jgi:hypothetical protein
MSRLRDRVLEIVRSSGLDEVEAARVTDAVVDEILELRDTGWKSHADAHVDAARRRLRDAHLFDAGMTPEQIEQFHRHYEGRRLTTRASSHGTRTRRDPQRFGR